MPKYIGLFFAILAGDLVAHYICKWLDKEKQKKFPEQQKNRKSSVIIENVTASETGDRREVFHLDFILSFIIAVAAGVVCHYIIKWLDGDK